MTADSASRTGAIRWIVPVLLLLVAGAVRAFGVDQPEGIYFDETYYVEDARTLLVHGVEEGFAVHPPVGKWLIAGGLALLGDHPAGWRAASVAAGTLTVLFVHLAALRLFRHRGVAALAGLLVAFDGLALAMSRIAMLEAALTLFVVAAFWLLLVDHDARWRALPDRDLDVPPGGRPPHRPRWARWGAGLVLGLALATKWSAVLALGAAVVVVVVGELAYRRRTTGRATAAWARGLGAIVLPLVVLPALVYVASYTGWFVGYEQTRPGVERCPDAEEPCAVPLPARVGDWAAEQVEIARFHLQLDADHPYRASALTWPTLARPIAYHYESCTPEREAELLAEGEECAVERGHVSHVLGLGNPALFWLALPAYLVLLWFGAVRRDWRALVVAAFLLGQYVPWLAAARPVFFFYATPLVPFVALSVAHAAWRAMLVHPALRLVPAGVALLAVAAFVFWFPLFTGLEIPVGAWRLRIWVPGWI